MANFSVTITEQYVTDRGQWLYDVPSTGAASYDGTLVESYGQDPTAVTTHFALTFTNTALPPVGADAVTISKSGSISMTVTDSAFPPTSDAMTHEESSGARTLTITESLGLRDLFYTNVPSQIGLHLEIKSIDKSTGLVRGPIPDRREVSLSPIFCDVGTVTFKYLRDGINADWVAEDEEFAVFLNETEIGDLRFVIDEVSDNDATEDEYKTVAGRTTLSWLDQAVVYPGAWPTTDPPRHDFNSATPGHILKTLLDRAFARAQAAGATDGILNLGYSTFSDTVDSNGAQWNQSKLVTASFDAGTSYLKVVQALVDMGSMEVRMAGRELIAFNADTMMVDRTVTNPPLVFRSGVNVVDSPARRSTRDLRTALLVAGGNNVYAEVKDPTAVAVYGYREGYVNQGNVNDVGTLTSYGQKQLEGTSEVRYEKTHGLTFANPNDPRPWYDFRLGDWVFSDYNTGVMERLRIKQWTIKEEDNGILTGTVVLNDLFAEKIERLSRDLDKIVSGATVVGGSEAPPSDGGGDAMPPGAPLGVTISSTIYTDPSGLILAQITVEWDPVTVDAQGNPASDVDHYLAEATYQGLSGIWSPIGQTADTTLYYSPVRPGADIWVRVAAVDTSGNTGAWTTAHAVIASDDQPPPIPTAPTATPYLGQMKITWDGKGTGGVDMPLDFKWAEVWISLINPSGLSDALWLADSSTKLLDTMSVGGVTMATDLTYGTTYYFRLRSADTSNNRSDFGPAGSGVPELISSTTDMTDVDKASISTTWMDDFNTLDSRWSRVSGSSTTSIVDVADGLTGGKSLAVVGAGVYEWGANIAFDPEVLYRVKARVRYAAGTSTGKQYISAGTNGSFETDINGWAAFYSATARSTTRAQQGTASMLCTWAAANDIVGCWVSGLTVGSTYTFSAAVWVPSGSAPVHLVVWGVIAGSNSTSTGAWQWLTATFVATSGSHWVGVGHVSTFPSNIKLQETFSSDIGGFYTTSTGGQSNPADMAFDASTVGSVPTGWTSLTGALVPNNSWYTTKAVSNATYSSSPHSFLMDAYFNFTMADGACGIQTTSSYMVTPGSQVTVSAKFKLTGYSGLSIPSGTIGICTSATSTPPTATAMIAIAQTGYQWSEIYLPDTANNTWGTATGTFTIPTGHNYCWVIVGTHAYCPVSTSAITVYVDDVTCSAGTPVSPPTFVNSSARGYDGTTSLAVTWNGASQNVRKQITVNAVQHCISAYVYGTEAVTIRAIRTTSSGSTVISTGTSYNASQYNTWQRLYVAVTPNATDTKLEMEILRPNITSSVTMWVDAIQVETGSTPTTYYTQPLGTVYVDATMVEAGSVRTTFSTELVGTGRLVTIGLQGVGADGTTYVSPTGTSSETITPIAAYQRDPSQSTWATYEGFVKGTAATGSLDDTLSASASTPGVMQSGTRYIRPAISVNQPGGTGTTQIDMFTVETLAFPSGVIQDFMVASMSAGKITAGAINAVLMVSEGKIVAGNPNGARVEMNTGGLYAYTADGDREFWLDSATGAAVFAGSMTASVLKTSTPPNPRIEISGDFAQRIDCYPDMVTAWYDPPGFRTGVDATAVVEMYGGTNAQGAGGRITVSFPNQPFTDPWFGGSAGSGSRITMTSDEVQVSGHILVGSWIDKIYNGYVRAACSLSGGLSHGATGGPYSPYNSLEARATPIKDLYLVKGAFMVDYGGYLGDGSSVGWLPTGFPAPARTQIIPAFASWTSYRAWLEIHAYTGQITLHGVGSATSTYGQSVKCEGMYDTY